MTLTIYPEYRPDECPIDELVEILAALLTERGDSLQPSPEPKPTVAPEISCAPESRTEVATTAVM
jgi:hypothetical protein